LPLFWPAKNAAPQIPTSDHFHFLCPLRSSVWETSFFDFLYQQFYNSNLRRLFFPVSGMGRAPWLFFFNILRSKPCSVYRSLGPSTLSPEPALLSVLLQSLLTSYVQNLSLPHLRSPGLRAGVVPPFRPPLFDLQSFPGLA